MSVIKLSFDRMKVASLRKHALGFGGGGGAGSSGGFSGSGGSSGFGFGGGSGGRNTQNRFNPVYDDLSEGTIVEQFMPVDFRRLHRIWRRIKLQDPVAGPAVDLYSELPWSDFQLIGIEDREIVQLYTDAANAIKLTTELPGITSEFLSMGKVIGHLLMDESRGIWDRMIIHDPDWIRVSPIPVPGFAPKLDIIPTPEMKAWAGSMDDRDIAAKKEIPELAAMIQNGQDIPLPMDNTFYLPRRSAPYDVVGSSVYTRIIMFVAYEKALVNATIAASRRRASRIRHITAGIDDVWEPSAEELDDLSSLFMQADEDPVGAIVVTRSGVQTNEVGGGSLQDITKTSDEWDFLSKGKLNALGVSEAFLTGDATFNTLEQLMSVFLEKIKAHRKYMEKVLIFEKIFKPLAKRHGFVHRKKAELSHRIRVARSPEDQKYILPTISWEKPLRPVADRDYLEILQMMQEKGIPITKRTWTSSAGFDLDSEMEQFDDDIEVSRRLAQQQKKMAQAAPPQAGAAGAGGLGGAMEGGGMGGLGELGGLEGDLGGALGGGGIEGLGDGMGGGGELGGMEGGALEGMGGADTGGAGGGLDLPAVGASVRTGAANFEVTAVAKPPLRLIDSLPFWGNRKELLGVSMDQAEMYAQRLLTHLGTQVSKKVTRGTARKLIATGNNRRDQVLRYVLSRVGILHEADITREVAKDIHIELMDRLGSDPQSLATELRIVAQCVQYGSRAAARAEEERHRLMQQEARAELRKPTSNAIKKVVAQAAEAAGRERNLGGVKLLTGV